MAKPSVEVSQLEIGERSAVEGGGGNEGRENPRIGRMWLIG
jgi:hypothetical protein